LYKGKEKEMEFEVSTKSSGELCEKLRKVTLRDRKTQPYANSFISIETIDPRKISPCQRYVLLPELRKIELLRWNIMDEYGWDILQLNGYLKVTYTEHPLSDKVMRELGDLAPENNVYKEKVIDVIPPVCEEFINDFGELKVIVNDGMHRIFLAYQMGVPINVVYVRGVNKHYPYYSYSLPRGFEEIEILDSISENYVKKFHVAKNHKALYRNFNSIFNNIGDSRPYTSEEDKRIITYEKPIRKEGLDPDKEKEMLSKEAVGI
jgi:hypothetical protein